MVVAHHASIMVDERLRGGLGVVWRNGAAGVDLFFVISGFVMALSSEGLMHRPHPAREFLTRRVQRIAPMYWLATTLKLILLLAVPALGLHAIGSAWHVLASYLFLPSRNAEGGVLPVLIVGWTLNFEMLFYVIFAAALALRVRTLRLLLPTLVALSAVPFFWRGPLPTALTLCHPILMEFLFGVALFHLYQRRPHLRAQWAWIAIFAGGIVLVAVPWGAESLLRPLVWGVPALAVVGGAIELEGGRPQRAPRWMLELGDASYSIYLSHTFALPAIGIAMVRIGMTGARWLSPAMIFAVFLSALLGDLLYRAIERPITRLFAQRRVVAA